MLVLVVLIGNLAVVASIFTGFLLFRRCLEGIEARVRGEFADTLRQLLTPPAEGEPSPLAIYTDTVATIFAARVVQQLKTAAAGVASGVAKEAQAEGIANLAGKSPLLALLSGLLPKKYRNALLASPQFTGQLRLGGNHQEQPAAESDTYRRLQSML